MLVVDIHFHGQSNITPTVTAQVSLLLVACPISIINQNTPIMFPSTALVNVLNSSDKVTVNGGRFTVSIQNGMPVVYSPASSLELDHPDVNIL